jgi:hypothetical protein
MNRNTIECANCGEEFYYELTRCPRCGRSVYPLDEDESTGGKPYSPMYRWVSPQLSFLYGWLVGSVIAFLLHQVLHQFVSPLLLTGQIVVEGNVDLVIPLLLTVMSMIGAFGGGFLTGSLARQQYMPYGIAFLLLYMVTTFLLETVWTKVTFLYMLQPINLIRWFLILSDGATGVWIAWKMAANRQSKRGIAPGGEDLYWDLLLKVRFDDATANRLIEHEKQRAPRASRQELIERAIQRWEKDNR